MDDHFIVYSHSRSINLDINVDKKWNLCTDTVLILTPVSGRTDLY